ncbi:MAG: FHA domain-containing protein [Candidatus Brocadiia bacterium]
MDSSAGKQARFHVVVTGRENDGRRFDIGSDGLLVGRSDTCDIVFSNREVSRRHAYFYPDGHACWVEDLGSRNGILVNGQRVERQKLRDGDVVDIGPSHFTVVSSDGVRRFSRWLSPAHAPGQGAEAETAALPSPAAVLAVAGLVFGVAAYMHWVLGLCALVLALLAFWEMTGQPARIRRSVMVCGIVIAVMGAACNLWFRGIAPDWRGREAVAHRQACRENLRKISDAISAYRADHGGRYPPNLHFLVGRSYATAETVRCPACEARPNVRDTYVYLPPREGDATDPYAVLVCDPSPRCHGENGGWVLRRDGRLSLTPPEQLRELLDGAAGASPAPGGG